MKNDYPRLKFLPILFLPLAIVLIVIWANKDAQGIIQVLCQSELSTESQAIENFKILLIADDVRPPENFDPELHGEFGFADAIRVIRIDSNDPKISILTIPRNLWVSIKGMEDYQIFEDRIKVSYTYGQRFSFLGSGPEMLAQTIEENFNLSTDKFVTFTVNSFSKAIDAIGGVDVCIEEQVGDEYFRGWQHFDGDEALAYTRIRPNNSSDLIRLDRQTLLLQSVFGKLKSTEILSKLPNLIISVFDSIETNLTFSELQSLACIGSQINVDDIQHVGIDTSMIESIRYERGDEILEPDFIAIRELVGLFDDGDIPFSYVVPGSDFPSSNINCKAN